MTLKEIFNHMDYNLDGFIVKSDIKQFVSLNGVFQPTDLDIESIFKKLDV